MLTAFIIYKEFLHTLDINITEYFVLCAQVHGGCQSKHYPYHRQTPICQSGIPQITRSPWEHRAGLSPYAARSPDHYATTAIKGWSLTSTAVT